MARKACGLRARVSIAGAFSGVKKRRQPKKVFRYARRGDLNRKVGERGKGARLFPGLPVFLFGLARRRQRFTLARVSPAFARLVFVLTTLFFAAFFLWPVLQILQGGFIDANGRLTFAY